MRRLVLRPAAMVHSTYENPPPPAYARFLSSGHEKRDTVVPRGYHVYPEMAAAGLWTTASDLGRWGASIMRAYNGASGGPLSPALAKQMLTPQIEVPSSFSGQAKSYWGLGVQLQGAGDSLRFSHGGRDEGFVADLVMWPARHRGIVILTNGVSGGLLQEIERAFGAEYGLMTSPRVEKRLAAVPASTLDSLPGHYLLTVGRDTINLTVARRGDVLWLSASDDPEGTRLLPQATDSFFDLVSGANFNFERPAGNPLGTPVKLVREFRGQRLEAVRTAASTASR